MIKHLKQNNMTRIPFGILYAIYRIKYFVITHNMLIAIFFIFLFVIAVMTACAVNYILYTLNN